MASLVLSGDTSGTVTLAAPTVAGTQSYTLPTAVPAANGYALTSTTGGTMSWASVATSAATPTALGTVYGTMASSGNPVVAIGYNAGAGSPGVNCTAMGFYALNAMTSSGSNSTAFGNGACQNLTGSYNDAFGVGAMLGAVSSTGTFNVAVGRLSLTAISSGNYNVAVGSSALASNTTASNSTAVGYQALNANTAADNTAVGYQSLLASTGIRNTAVGSGALVANTTGTLNVAVGYQAIPANTVGAQNVGIGYQALLNANGTGNTNNIAIGVQAGVNITSGTNNLTIGTSNAGTLSTGSGNIGIGGFNSSGSSAPVYAFGSADNNRVQIGSTAVTNAYVQVAWTVVSDARDKTDFQPIPHGLSFVQQLNPVSFYFKESRDSDVKVGTKRYGFKAQEVLALEGDDAVIIDNEDDKKLRYNGEALVPVLVKAIQELSTANESLTARIAALEAK